MHGKFETKLTICTNYGDLDGVPVDVDYTAERIDPDPSVGDIHGGWIVSAEIVRVNVGIILDRYQVLDMLGAGEVERLEAWVEEMIAADLTNGDL